MKKTMKRALSFLLATVMLALTACGDTAEQTKQTEEKQTVENETPKTSETEVEELYYNETGYPICDEPITIKVGGINYGNIDPNVVLLTKTVEEKLGIKMEFELYPADAFAQQYALMLSTGDIPDMIINGYTVSKAQVNKDGEGGFWLDMSQYLDLMPNLVAFMEEYPDFGAYQKTGDGKLYSLCRTDVSSISTMANGQIFYDKRLLEAAGVGEINTVDDFYEALKAVKKAYPDKIPFSYTCNGSPAYAVEGLFHNAFGIDSIMLSGILTPDENGKLELAEVGDNYREFLKYMNKLYEEGLLDPISLAPQGDYTPNYQAGKYVFYSYWNFAPSVMTEEDKALTAEGDYSVMRNYGSIIALTSDLQPEKTKVKGNPVTAQGRIFVNAKTEYPEAICRLLDYFATEEGQLLATFGVEGESFEFIDDGYGNKLINYDRFIDPSCSNYMYEKVIIPQAFAYAWSKEVKWLDDATEESLKAIAKDDKHSRTWDAEMILRYRDEIKRDLVQMTPRTFTDEENSELAPIKTDISTYLLQMRVAFISGEFDPNSDEDWNNFVQTVERMGLARMLEIEQAAWDRVAANLK